MKFTADMLYDFKKVASKIKKRKSLKNACNEISFEDKKDFNRFV